MGLQQFVNYRKMGGWLQAFNVICIINIVLSAISLISVLPPTSDPCQLAQTKSYTEKRSFSKDSGERKASFS